MTSMFKKLNLKDQTPIVVLNAPPSFEPELAALIDVAISRKIGKGEKTGFGIAFVVTQKQLDEASAALASAAEGDAVLWLAYPKTTSKRYKCEFNRDRGWDVLGRAGFEGVRQVAIDEDWSALRFRRVEYIKSMTRAPQRALTQTGKHRAAK
ncbi:hypothetical protein [Stenotrophomonas sp. NLF4-10]|uniref:hypothetical protein n=1 Tax=Stenotrophomonas sp. NLF4-10 TaxID=2918754 RepID=UPI001EFAE345|nr:hypothetical protein [Stenotrophomonas sp. NLF4-10]MCG8277445.1 hypothetical protein [Stenotrophomonas sp. NLF4-10]